MSYSADCYRKQPPQTTTEPSGEDVQPIGAEYYLNDSCLGQSDCSKLGP